MLTSFVEHLNTLDISPETRRALAGDLRHFDSWLRDSSAGSITLEDVTTIEIVRYRTSCISSGLKPATINRRLNSLKKLYRWARDAGRCTVDPAAPVKAVEQVEQPPRALSAQEESRLVAAAQRGGARDLAVIVVMLHTGLRLSEVCALTIADVAIRERSGMLTVRAGKGMKRRDVPLNVTARRALRAWLDIMPADPNSFLFPGREAARMTARGLSHIVTKYAKASGVHASPHTLRHTFARRMKDAGVRDEDLADLLGHEDINTTRRYGKSSPGDLQSAVDKIAWE